MVGERAFEELVHELQEQGLTAETAAEYATLVGDTPVQGKDGKLVVVADDGKEVARLKWPPMFGLNQVKAYGDGRRG